MSAIIRSLFAIALVSAAVPVSADFVVVSKAYEVPVSELRLPGAVNGTITFRECRDCDYQTVRVTAQTQYEANGETLTLEEFRKKIEAVRDPSDVTATVLHHLESDTIEAIRVRF